MHGASPRETYLGQVLLHRQVDKGQKSRAINVIYSACPTSVLSFDLHSPQLGAEISLKRSKSLVSFFTL